MALCIIRRSRTISTQAALVLLEMVLWDSETQERKKRYNDHWARFEDTKRGSLRLWQGKWSARPPLEKRSEWLKRTGKHLTYYTTQVITRHRKFHAFLHRLQKIHSANCTHFSVMYRQKNGGNSKWGRLKDSVDWQSKYCNQATVLREAWKHYVMRRKSNPCSIVRRWSGMRIWGGSTIKSDSWNKASKGPSKIGRVYCVDR